MSLSYLIVVALIGAVYTQSEPSISDAINSLPPELQGKVDEAQLNAIKNSTTEAFREKCEKNGGADAFSKVEAARSEFEECIKRQVNFTRLQEEIEDAKPNGQVDEVFKKYCDKTPSFKACFQNMTDSIQPCFTAEEQKNLKTVHSIFEQVAEFICFKEGDRIALFIAEHGPECLQEKQDAIQECVKKTVGINFDQNNITNFNIESIPKLQFGEKECDQFATMEACVVKSLETCSAPTSANIIESLYKFIRKATPCKDEVKKAPNAANLSAKSMGLGLILLAFLI